MRPVLKETRLGRVKDPHRWLRPGRARVDTAAAPSAKEQHFHVGLYSGEPENCRRDLRQFLPILLNLALVLGAVHVYQLEGRAFQIVLTLAAAALPVHYMLPLRWKKPFFMAVTFAGIVAVFGWLTAASVMVVGSALLGTCHLRAIWPIRAGLIAAMAVTLALSRAGLLPLGIPAVAWPLLGSIFMFRMIILLYELKHATKPERLVDTASYFLLLPNLCFLHFPVVDYRTLLRGEFAAEIHATQRRGLQMLVRGITHLLLYRFVYHLVLISPDDVRNIPTLAQFLTCNYFLYLRVSGQFHAACGLLHLFGFQLPETHRHYFLATGFTDYWRRINIYWKDFMVRVVFHPIMFRLKKWRQSRALVVATLSVFVTTWALHAYQSFWLRGRWGFSAPDALFWGVLGVLVLVNVQSDARRPRVSPRTKAARKSPREIAVHWLKVAGTFTTLAVLWSLWSSPSVSDWIAMFRRSING